MVLHRDKGGHDADAHVDSDIALEDGWKHGDALLGEDERQFAAAAVTWSHNLDLKLDIAICDIKFVYSSLVNGNKILLEILICFFYLLI